MNKLANVEIYVNSSNRNAVCVLECSTPASLESISNVSIELLNGTIIDSATYPDCFTWNIMDGTKCVIHLYLGRASLGLENGVYNADLFLFDEYNYQGAHFGKLRLFVYNRG